MINDLLGMFPPMTIEQYGLLLIMTVSAIYGFFQWFGTRIAKERDAKLALQDVEIAKAKAKISEMESKTDLQAKESESRHLQMIETLRLLAQSNDNFKDVGVAIRESAKSQDTATQRLIAAIERNSDKVEEITDVIETQSTHFQNLTEDIREAKQASHDARVESETLKQKVDILSAQISNYKQVVDSMINRFDTYVEHAPKKGEWASLKESVGKTLRDLETTLDEWKLSLDAVQKQSELITNTPKEPVTEKEAS